MTPKPMKKFSKFTEENLPKLPDWKANLPKFDPNAAVVQLGPPSSSLKKDQNLIEAYLGGDYVLIELDMQRRPDHYTPEQRDIIAKLKAKEPLPPGVGHRELNEIMLRFMETTKHSEERQKVLQRVQKKIEDQDPDTEIERNKNEEAQREHAFEDGVDKRSAFIKII